MNNQEVNKIIAEFMGASKNPRYFGYCSVCEDWHNGKVQCTDIYTKCLDALVPVWEKLKYESKRYE